jgi:aspartate/methionine/tyrosine aminotransferase
VAFPRLTGVGVEQFCDTLRRDFETTVVPGRFFEMPDRIRVSLVAPTEILREGLERIQHALRQLGTCTILV